MHDLFKSLITSNFLEDIDRSDVYSLIFESNLQNVTSRTSFTVRELVSFASDQCLETEATVSDPTDKI